MALYLNKAMFKQQIDKSFYYGLGFFGGAALDFLTASEKPSPSIPYDSIIEVFETSLGEARGLTPKTKKTIKDKLSPLGVELTDGGVGFLYNSYLDCLEPNLYNNS